MRPIYLIALLPLVAACDPVVIDEVDPVLPDFDEDCVVAAEDEFTIEYLDDSATLWACPGDAMIDGAEVVAEKDGITYYSVPGQ